jgi:GGDEF domain-containing protein
VGSNDDSTVEHVLGRFAETIKNYNQQAKRGYDIKYSFGYEPYSPEANPSIEDLLKAADEKMYKMKSTSASNLSQ